MPDTSDAPAPAPLRPGWHASITQRRINAAAKRSMTSLDHPGICIHCGKSAQDVEPDAARRRCGKCGENGVYGAEQLAIMTFR